jgi:hypothetical protein
MLTRTTLLPIATDFFYLTGFHEPDSVLVLGKYFYSFYSFSTGVRRMPYVTCIVELILAASTPIPLDLGFPSYLASFTRMSIVRFRIQTFLLPRVHLHPLRPSKGCTRRTMGRSSDRPRGGGKGVWGGRGVPEYATAGAFGEDHRYQGGGKVVCGVAA